MRGARQIGGDLLKEIGGGEPRSWRAKACRLQPVIDQMAVRYLADRVSFELLDHDRILEVGLWQSGPPETGHVFQFNLYVWDHAEQALAVDWPEFDRITCDPASAIQQGVVATGAGHAMPRSAGRAG